MTISYDELKKLDENKKYLKYHNLAQLFYHEIEMSIIEEFKGVTISVETIANREHSIHKIAGNIVYELAKLKVIPIPDV